MKELREKLSQFFETVAATRRGVVSAYLFGSHSQEKAHRESDVDVAVLLDRAHYATAGQRFQGRVTLGSALVSALKQNEVDLVVLNDLPPLFARRIVREGVRVYCADTEKDRVFQRDVQMKAADLQPFLEKMRKTKLKALAP